MNEKPRRVIVSHHAIERGYERIPGANRDGDIIPVIFASVQQAFTDGRVAKREPRWITYGQYRPSKNKGRRRGDSGTWRYAWTEDETHAFLLVHHQDDDGDYWVVQTVLARRLEEAA